MTHDEYRELESFSLWAYSLRDATTDHQIAELARKVTGTTTRDAVEAATEATALALLLVPPPGKWRWPALALTWNLLPSPAALLRQLCVFHELVEARSNHITLFDRNALCNSIAVLEAEEDNARTQKLGKNAVVSYRLLQRVLETFLPQAEAKAEEAAQEAPE